MEKIAIIACLVAALLIGGLFVYAVFPREVEVVKEVEKIVEKEVQVEVEKIVEKDYKAEALELCKEKFLEDYNLDKYEELAVRDVSKTWSISFDENKKDKEKMTVTLDNVEIRIFDSLEDEKTNFEGVCVVKYVEDKEPKVDFEPIELD